MGIASYQQFRERLDGLRTFINANPSPFRDEALTEQARSQVKALYAALLQMNEEIAALEAEVRVLQAMEAIKARIAAARDSSEAATIAMEAIIELFGAERGLLAIKDPLTGELKPQAQHNLDAAEGGQDLRARVMTETIERGESILTDNATADARYQGQESIVGFSLRSIVAVPLKSGDDVIGAVYLDNRLRQGLFKPQDAQRLAQVVEQIGGMLQPAAPTPKSREQVTPASQAVTFAAYYPPEVKSGVWETLYAYVAREFAVPLVEADARQQLGERLAQYRLAERTAQAAMEEGALITATPSLPGFQFNPPTITIGFYDDWQRLDFKLRVKDAPTEQAANGQLTFSTEGVIVAEIPLSVFVTEKARGLPPTAVTQQPYNAVFCSYSHSDGHIVERVERACRTLGLEYLRDVHTLKSGQAWNDELYRLIERADIFQLFWSPTAVGSEYVEKEWRHALSLGERPHFVRPVYWIKPIPTVPEELSHIHFAYQPDLVE